MRDDVDLLTRRLREVGEGLLLVVTGAGVSAASGLATFRGPEPDAIWTRDVLEMGTRAYFERDPVDWWRWFLDRFGGILDVKPNAGHRALADLERWHRERGGDFLLVTQNIDVLHEKAGTERLVKVHGSADRLRCSRPGCPHGAPAGSLPVDRVDLEAFRRDPTPEHLPRCPECGALLRAHALLFDEYYHEHEDYGWDRVQAALERVHTQLFVGTSFAVGVTELALRSGWMRGVPAMSVDPGGEPPAGVAGLRQPAEALLPAVTERLREKRNVDT